MHKEPAETSSTPDSTSKSNFLIAILCGLLISAHFISSFFPKTRLWGINHLAYFPLWVRLLFTITGLLILVPWVNSRVYQFLDRILSFFQRVFPKREVLTASLLAVISIFFFWFLRTRTYFLGDGYTLISELRGERYAKIGFEPLEIFFHLYLYKFLKLFSTPSPELIYAGLSILAGGVFIFVLVFLSRILAENRLDRLFVFSIFLFSGATELFLGYAENYTLVYVSILAYLYFSIRYLQGKAKIYLPILFCALSMSLHISSGYLLPSLFFLFTLKRKEGELFFGLKRALPYLFALILLFVLSIFYIWSMNPVLSEIFIPLFKGRTYAPGYTLFSFPHILDVINQFLLLSPVGIILLLNLIIAFKNRVKFTDLAIIFLLIVSLAQLIFHFIVDPKLGAARDWDLLSNLALGHTLLGVCLFTSLVRLRRYSAVVLIFVLFISTSPWFILNANTERAILRVGDLLDLDLKKSLNGRWALAKYYFQEKDYMKVKEIRSEINKLFPEDSLTREAEAYLKLEDYDQATELLKKVMEINPSFWVAYNDLGLTYLRQGEVDKALNEFQKVVRINPYNSIVRVNLGRALLLKERLQEALAELKKAEKLGGIEPDVYCGIAYIYRRFKEIEKAIKAYKKALKKDTGIYCAHFGLGQVYLDKNQLDEALAEFQEVVRLKPDYDLVYYHLGLVYAYKGMKAKAIEEFELFLSLSKDQTQNQQVRGWIQRLQSQKP
jgi:tetratricopeptide (TPR) repeat protein